MKSLLSILALSLVLVSCGRDGFLGSENNSGRGDRNNNNAQTRQCGFVGMSQGGYYGGQGGFLLQSNDNRFFTLQAMNQQVQNDLMQAIYSYGSVCVESNQAITQDYGMGVIRVTRVIIQNNNGFQNGGW